MLLLLTIFACDRSGDEYVPKSVDGYDGVAVLGEVVPMVREDLLDRGLREEGITYATLGTTLRWRDSELCR